MTTSEFQFGATKARLSGRLRLASAFTLVELLVVIGIIAVLIGILFPVFHKARQQALSVMCQSNIRQICHACLMYGNENRGLVPNPYESVARPWPGSAIQPLDRGKYSWEIGTIWPYVSSSVDIRRRLFNCPSDVDPRPSADNFLTLDPRHPRNFSYCFNGYMAIGPPPLRFTQIRHPWRKLMILELQAPNFPEGSVSCAGGGVTPGSNVICLLTTRHQKLANVGFFDGHVESMNGLIFASNRVDVFTDAYRSYVELPDDQTEEGR